MPTWKPAVMGNRPVRSYYRLPVNMGRKRVARTAKQKEKAAELELAATDFKVVYDTEGGKKYVSKSFGQGSMIQSGREKELDGVIYELDQLGWVNCDKFLKMNGQMISFSVDRKGLENFNFFLFLKNIRGIIGPRFYDKNILFASTPNQMACLLTGMKSAINLHGFWQRTWWLASRFTIQRHRRKSVLQN